MGKMNLLGASPEVSTGYEISRRKRRGINPKRLKIDKKNAMLILSALGLFLLCNAMWIVLTRFGLFSDEADNLLGGKIIADGGILYKDYLSQHTPLMYYICALFHKLGCVTVPQYRTAFYMLLSIVWVFIYVRYSRYFGKITLILYPIIYIFAVSSIDMAFTILSDQIEANALLILFLEFLLFERTKTLKLSNCIIISAAIFFAVGTALVALYPLLFIFIGVICLEIIWYFKNKSGWDVFALNTLKRYSMLVSIVALPFAILISVLAMQHVLISAYNGAYLNNVTHYVNQSGVSGNIIETIISVFQNFIIYIKDVFTAFAGIGPLVKAHGLQISSKTSKGLFF
jgi:hypothetical protein